VHSPNTFGIYLLGDSSGNRTVAGESAAVFSGVDIGETTGWGSFP
jgi:hypothetical protein